MIFGSPYILSIGIILFCAHALQDSSAASVDKFPDTILTNGKFVTVDDKFSVVEAVAIKNEIFFAVGSNREIRALAGKSTTIQDLEGKTAIPGIIDGHAHMDREGLKFVYPSLTGARSIADILHIIEREVRKRKPGEWVVTMPIGDYPFYENNPEFLAEKRFPNRWDLDKVSPNNPVYIKGSWYYWRGDPPIVSIANSLALELAGITEESTAPNPELEIVRQNGTGLPTGVFIERGTVGTVEFSLMKDVPRFTYQQRLGALKQSMHRYNAVGTTGVYEGHGVSSVVLRAYKELWEREELTVRSTLVISPAWDAVPGAKPYEVLRDWATFASGKGVGDD